MSHIFIRLEILQESRSLASTSHQQMIKKDRGSGICMQSGSMSHFGINILQARDGTKGKERSND